MALQVAAEIRKAGGEAVSLAGDVTAEEFPGRCVETAVDAFGTIDILINNAGAGSPRCFTLHAWHEGMAHNLCLMAIPARAGFTWDGMLHKISQKQWDAMLAVHCTAPFRLIQAAAPVMREAAKKELDEQGAATQRCIINVSSTSGTHGNAGQANYSTVTSCCIWGAVPMV